MEKPRVIFLCTGNSARSQMAEGFMRAYAGEYFDVYSAGLDPKGLNPFAVAAMDEVGLDISGHTSNSVKDYLGHVVFTYVVTVCDHAEANCPTAFLHQGEHFHWSFEDPAAVVGSDEAKRAKFAAIRDQIREHVRAWVDELSAAGKMN